MKEVKTSLDEILFLDNIAEMFLSVRWKHTDKEKRKQHIMASERCDGSAPVWDRSCAKVPRQARCDLIILIHFNKHGRTRIPSTTGDHSQ